MKKSTIKFSIPLLLCILTLGLFTPASAQSVDNVVKTRPFAPLSRSLTLAYEKPLNESMSFQVEGKYKFPRSFAEGVGFSGKLRVTPEVKFYLSPSKQSPEGLYLAPFLRYSVQGARSGNETADLHFFGGGGSVGYQLLTNKGFAMEMFTGFGYGRATADIGDDDQIISTGVGLPIMRLGLAMGIGW